MKFRLLGPVEVDVAGRPVPVPRRRERCLLGVLLLELGRPVDTDRLADLLWDGRPPAGARRLLSSHASRLRAILRATDGAGQQVALRSTRNGYRFEADPGRVDVHRFRAEYERSRRTSDPHERLAALRSALALWRGRPLADAASELLRKRICADLEELQIQATEALLGVRLALGQLAEALPELARLVNEHPVREPIVERYVQALAHTGRTAEALAAYQQARTRLAEELGVEPGRELRRLHQQLLPDQPATSPLISRTVQLSPTAFERLRAEADRRGVGAATLLRELVETALATLDRDRTVNVRLADLHRAIDLAALRHVT